MRALLIVLGIAFGLAAFWSVSWIFASASLACVPCNCTYSLFHEYDRCRQPYYAIIASGVTGLAAIGCFVGAAVHKQRQG